MPLSERFFLGGETTVRGYKPYILGEHFRDEGGSKEKDEGGKAKDEGSKAKDEGGKEREEAGKERDDPIGGVSSSLVSIEYNQQLFKMMDGFVFFDGGSISDRPIAISDFRMSYGVGLRISLGNQLPITVGIGFPINPRARLKKVEGEKKVYDKKADVQKFFVSMGGQF